MLGSSLLYFGSVVALLGSISLARPLAFFGITTRRQGALFLGAGLTIAAVGLYLPARNVRIETVRTRLDEFAPAYQFNEVHRVQVRAPRDRAYRAIKEVRADEIMFFRVLIWVRRFGQRGPESILNAPEHMPLLEIATRTTFLVLAEDPGREIVIGTLVVAPSGARVMDEATPEQFKALDRPGFAKAAMSFRIEDAGPDACVVTTETRVYAADAATRRRFAAYWRVIYPGSALIRRMWLRAVKLRAE